MPSKVKLKVKESSDEEDTPRASMAKKGKRTRQVEDGSSSSERIRPPAKRRSSSTAPSHSRSKKSVDSDDQEEGEEGEVDVQGSDSEVSREQDDSDTASARSASPAPAPAQARKQPLRAERVSKSRTTRIQSDDEPEEQSEPEDAVRPPVRQTKPALPPIPRAPVRQPTGSSSSSTPTTKPLRKPVTSKPRDKETNDKGGSTLSNIPAIPRRPKDASAVVKDTQDMDLLNKDVYNQLFNTSNTSKPVKVQNEARQREIEAKRAAAKAALVEARASSFDLQLPTDKVLAFENRLRKLHRWYAPSALGFTYHEEVRQQRDGNQGAK